MMQSMIPRIIDVASLKVLINLLFFADVKAFRRVKNFVFHIKGDFIKLLNAPGNKSYVLN